MRPNDGNGDPLGGDRRNQYLATTGYEPVVVQGGRDLTPGWWPEQVEAEEPLDLIKYWHILVKHRLVVAGVFVATVVLGVAMTLLMTPIYTASATIQIDREAAKIVDVGGVTPAEVVTGEEFFQTQYGLLKSGSVAERTVDKLGLARDNSFIETMGENGQDNPATRRKVAIGVLTENLGVRPVRGSRLVDLTFDSPDPKLSARVANGVADNFIEYNLERRYEAASYARKFLEDRLAQVKARLEETEKQLVAYAADQQIINIIPMVGSVTSGAEQTASQSLTAADLAAMNTALASARQQRILAEQKWRQAQGADAMSLPEVIQNPTIQALNQRKAQLQSEYQQKLAVYKPSFPAMEQLQAQIEQVEREINTQVQTVRRSIQGQYQVASRQEASLAGQVSSLKTGVMDLRNRSIQYNILQREVDTNRTLYDGLLQRYKEVGIAGGVGTNNISIVDRAEPPGAPSRPKPLLNIGIAALLGLLLGAGCAFLLELLDESIQAPQDIETKLGVPLLGAIPALPRNVTLEEALEDPRSAISEAYYSVRTALQFSTPTGAPDILLITSTRASEGKSTTAQSVAVNFARLGMQVLLIDADLRNPSLHRSMRGDNSAGLSNLLAGISALSEVVQPTKLPTLSFIPCGPLPPNPAELLAGQSLSRLLVEARQRYDMVVIDGPPVLGLADVPLLASAATGVLMVVEAGGTRRRQAAAAVKRLGQSGRKLVGAVLTKFNAKQAGYGYGYSYAYDYDYGQRPQIPAQG